MLNESNSGRYNYSPEVLSLTIGRVQISFQVHMRPHFAHHAFPYPASEIKSSRSRSFVEHGCKPSRPRCVLVEEQVAEMMLFVLLSTRRNSDEVQYPAVSGEFEVT
jgi:hypothetical protein